MEVPRLGLESELQLLAYTTATAMPDLRLVRDLHHSSRQHWILNPLSEARDRTHMLMDTRWVCYRWATTGTPWSLSLIWGPLTMKKEFQSLSHQQRGIRAKSSTCTTAHGNTGSFNPLSVARNWICILMVHYFWATMGTPNTTYMTFKFIFPVLISSLNSRL